MKKTRISKRLDRKILKHSTSKTKAINLRPLSMRGGVRL